MEHYISNRKGEIKKKSSEPYCNNYCTQQSSSRSSEKRLPTRKGEIVSSLLPADFAAPAAHKQKRKKNKEIRADIEMNYIKDNHGNSIRKVIAKQESQENRGFSSSSSSSDGAGPLQKLLKQPHHHHQLWIGKKKHLSSYRACEKKMKSSHPSHFFSSTTTDTSAVRDTTTISSQQSKWNHMFGRLLAFREEYGHCLVPNRYRRDPSLGSWVSTQRRQYKILVSGSSESSPMTAVRAKQLERIGFVWVTRDPRHAPWEQRYRELCDFKTTHGNCLVPIGYTENTQLSNWVSTQRQEYKLLREGRPTRLTTERIQFLNNIGFVWEAQRGGPKRNNPPQKRRREKELMANSVEGIGKVSKILKMTTEQAPWSTTKIAPNKPSDNRSKRQNDSDDDATELSGGHDDESAAVGICNEPSAETSHAVVKEPAYVRVGTANSSQKEQNTARFSTSESSTPSIRLPAAELDYINAALDSRSGITSRMVSSSQNAARNRVSFPYLIPPSSLMQNQKPSHHVLRPMIHYTAPGSITTGVEEKNHGTSSIFDTPRLVAKDVLDSRLLRSYSEQSSNVIIDRMRREQEKPNKTSSLLVRQAKTAQNESVLVSNNALAREVLPSQAFLLDAGERKSDPATSPIGTPRVVIRDSLVSPLLRHRDPSNEVTVDRIRQGGPQREFITALSSLIRDKKSSELAPLDVANEFAREEALPPATCSLQSDTVESILLSSHSGRSIVGTLLPRTSCPPFLVPAIPTIASRFCEIPPRSQVFVTEDDDRFADADEEAESFNAIQQVAEKSSFLRRKGGNSSRLFPARGGASASAGLGGVAAEEAVSCFRQMRLDQGSIHSQAYEMVNLSHNSPDTPISPLEQNVLIRRSETGGGTVLCQRDELLSKGLQQGNSNSADRLAVFNRAANDRSRPLVCDRNSSIMTRSNRGVARTISDNDMVESDVVSALALLGRTTTKE